MQMFSRRAGFLAALAILTVVVAGCGGTAAPAPEDSAPVGGGLPFQGGAATPAPSLDLTMPSDPGAAPGSPASSLGVPGDPESGMPTVTTAPATGDGAGVDLMLYPDGVDPNLYPDGVPSASTPPVPASAQPPSGKTSPEVPAASAAASRPTAPAAPTGPAGPVAPVAPQPVPAPVQPPASSETAPAAPAPPAPVSPATAPPAPLTPVLINMDQIAVAYRDAHTLPDPVRLRTEQTLVMLTISPDRWVISRITPDGLVDAYGGVGSDTPGLIARKSGTAQLLIDNPTLGVSGIPVTVVISD